MPSETVDHLGLSPSSFFSFSPSSNVAFPSERQVGFWKSEAKPDHNVVGKSVDSSVLEKITARESQSTKFFGHPQSFGNSNQKIGYRLDKLAVGAERTLSQSVSLRSLDSDPVRSASKILPMSCIPETGKVDMIGSQYESSLFSSSLSELFSRKLRLNACNTAYGQSVDTVASHVEEEEPLETLEEIEAQTIGNLLPRDEDLFTGLTDKSGTTGGEDAEELDLFSSVGGMDLEDDGSAAQDDSKFLGGMSNLHPGFSNCLVAGEHPYGENPSRTLFVRNINSNVEDSELRAVFEQYGDIRTLYTSCKHRGFVMISYYDIRAATNAMKALQNKPLRRRKLDIHYSIPKDNPSENDFNQGILDMFNLDSSVSDDELKQIFGVYGDVKEIRESQRRGDHKFIEYYDTRSAEAALQAMNKREIAGKQIILEPSHPGGCRRFLQKLPSGTENGTYILQNSSANKSMIGFQDSDGAILGSSMENGTMFGVSSPIQAPFLESAFHHGNSSVPNGLPSLLRNKSAPKQVGPGELGAVQGFKFDLGGALDCHPHSLPDFHDVLNGSLLRPGGVAANINLQQPSERIESTQLSGVFGSASNGNCSLPPHHYAWNNSLHPEHTNLMWPGSPSFGGGISIAHPMSRFHGPPRAPPQILNPVITINNHHVGSAPTGSPSFWDRQHSFVAKSPEASGFHPGSLGSMRIPNNALHSMELVAHNFFPNVAGNGMDLLYGPKNIGLHSHQGSTMFPGRPQMNPTVGSFDPPNERARSRRNEGSVNQADKKQYELDLDWILRGEDNRTTLMIKNIPNKYTSKMLLAAIDECHRGTYDFIYLPIDFKNKCNVGYAFINMIEPGQIIPFYQSFNGKKWEKFNSEKVALLAYARIQGKAALIAHFQNSSLMNEDKRCRPILFSTDGPNAGDQVPFPLAVNVRIRPGKPRAFSNDENQQGIPPSLANTEDFANGDASSGSGKESN